jgi:ATP-dependent exoDNAse (exonuclease V) beta subunit
VADTEARDRGIVMHALLELVAWIEDFHDAEPTVAARMLNVCRTKAPRRDMQWTQDRIAEFRHAIRRPELAALLSRAHAAQQAPAGSTLGVNRELRFARLVEGGVQSGAIDRVVVARNAEGQPLRAWIVDFKTDQGAPDEAERMAEAYAAQMQAYIDVVSRTLTLGPDRIEATVAFLSIDRAVPVRAFARNI